MKYRHIGNPLVARPCAISSVEFGRGRFHKVSGIFFTHEQWYFRLWSKYLLWLSFSGRRFSNDVELLAFDHFWVTFGRIFTTHAQKQQYQLSVVIFWHYHWVQRLQFIAR